MGFLTRLASVLALATMSASAVVVLAASGAHADVGDPVLTSPVAGEQVELGFAGPVTIDFTNASWDEYDVQVVGPSGVVAEDYHYGNDVEEFSIPAIVEGGEYNVRVRDYYGGSWVSIGGFSARYEGMRVSDPVLSPETFYPLVRDSYRDKVRLTVTFNQRASVLVAIRNSAGKAVRSYTTSFPRGRRVIEWNGRTNSGNAAPVGRYAIHVRATNGSGSTATTVRRTTIATALVTREGAQRRYGADGAGSTSGSCYIADDGASAELDCWGGRYAKLTMSFAIPSNAYDFSWGVSGEYSSSDICCTGGVKRAGTRPSSNRFRVSVTVTGWRAYLVHSSVVKYKYKKRI